MADAMNLVRSILGEDAIVVASREESDGVRITAAIDDAAFTLPPATAATTAGALATRHQLGHGAAAPGLIDQVVDTLNHSGTPPALVQDILQAIEGLVATDALVALAAGLSATFRFDPFPTNSRQTLPVALTGPPGVGKTLAIAKLTTRAIMSGHSVGLVTTDTIRAGGVEQLAGFARLLKVRLVTVDEPGLLADALTVHQGRDMVWIDTPGRNIFDPSDLEEQAAFFKAVPVEPVLVLPAGGDIVESAEIADAFRSLGARRMMATRLDTSRRYGSLLVAASSARLAFADATNSASVHDGLWPLSPMALARVLFSLERNQKGEQAIESKETAG